MYIQQYFLQSFCKVFDTRCPYTNNSWSFFAQLHLIDSLHTNCFRGKYLRCCSSFLTVFHIRSRLFFHFFSFFVFLFSPSRPWQSHNDLGHLRFVIFLVAFFFLFCLWNLIVVHGMNHYPVFSAPDFVIALHNYCRICSSCCVDFSCFNDHILTPGAFLPNSARLFWPYVLNPQVCNLAWYSASPVTWHSCVPPRKISGCHNRLLQDSFYFITHMSSHC